MSDGVRIEYLDILADFHLAESRFEVLHKAIERAHQRLAMNGWKRIRFEGYDFPSPYMHLVTELQDLPSVDELAASLAEWHRLRIASQLAYRRIPDQLRVGLEEPPPFLFDERSRFLA